MPKTIRNKFDKWDTKPYYGKGNFIGKATRQASQRPDNDNEFRASKRVDDPRGLTRLRHIAGELGLYIKVANGVHWPGSRIYRVCEDYPAKSEKIAGIWRITKPAQKIRHHKEPWVTLATAWELVEDLDAQWNPPKPITMEMAQNHTRI